MSLTYINFCLTSEVRIENIRNEDANALIESELSSRFLDLSIKSIYTLIFSGVTRNIVILVLAGFNQLELLFNFLIILVGSHSLLLFYVVFFRIFKN